MLAATLSSNYGIYGPLFELQENAARSPGSEEYSRSEKYEIRSFDRNSFHSLAGFAGLVNRIRREHPALQFNDELLFHPVDNEQIIAYSKSHPVPMEPQHRTETPHNAPRGGDTRGDIILVIVNLDHFYVQSAWVDIDLESLGVAQSRRYVVHDLLTDARYWWEGSHNFVKLDPADVPCHIFSLEQPTSETSAPKPRGSR